jgi:hypothetical protein
VLVLLGFSMLHDDVDPTCAKSREFSGMVHWLTINNNPSNPIPIHSLRLAPVSDDDGDDGDDDDDDDM